MFRPGFLSIALAAAPAYADPPRVVASEAIEQGAGWTIAVTLAHPDTGWDHYASGWEVLDPDNVRLGYRELTHPHVEEQPFTRTLTGVAIPKGLTHVLIRPRCNLDGWVGSTTRLDLPE
jgi:hypothetical protein